MKTNVGSFDAGARFLLGCALLFMTVNGFGWWGALGFSFILSCALGFCPLYWLLGVNTQAWEERWEERRLARQLPPAGQRAPSSLK